MSIRLVLFVLSVVYFINSISSREVIQRLHSPRITNWGKWGGLEFCPQNSYVGGMNLKIQGKQGTWRDDSGLNAIQLQCVTMDWNYQGKITSLTGSSGNYRNIKYCPKGIATGFQLRSEPPQGGFKDDAGAVDFMLKCTNFDGTTSYVRNDQGSLKFGKWTQEQNCPPRSAVCGIATQVEDEGGKDDTALNNVDLACCKIPNPAETCKLEKKWQTVTVCPKAGNECEINFTTGFVQNKYEKLSKYYKSLGFIVDFKFVQKTLKRKAKKYGSKTINDKYPEHIINETQIEQKHWSDRLNCEGIIQQLVFTCGQFKVYTKEYRCVPRVGQGKFLDLYIVTYTPTS